MNIRHRLTAYGHLGRIVFMGLLIVVLAVAVQLLTIDRFHQPLPLPGLRIPNGDPGERRMLKSYAELPLSFEPNLGQADDTVKFVSRGFGYNLYLSNTEAVLALRESEQNQQETGSQGYSSSRIERSRRIASGRTSMGGATEAKSIVVHMRLVGSNPSPAIVGRGMLPGKSNYFSGSDPKGWLTDLPTFGRVEYDEVYPGIDLMYYGNQQQLEYDFVVAPGIDPGIIGVEIQGVDGVEVDADGNLVFSGIVGRHLKMHKPLIYQEKEGRRLKIEGRYVLADANLIRFQISEYDRSSSLVIDPQVVYVAHFGTNIEPKAIAVDNQGNAHVAGIVQDIWLPVVNAVQPTYASPQWVTDHYDGFVCKINAEGTQFIYCTYLGGRENDECNGVAVNDLGETYITGTTDEVYGGDTPKFPTKNAFQSKHGGWKDAFITKLSSAGNEIIFSTFFGGTEMESGVGIAVDRSQNVYITGNTETLDSTQNASFPIKNPYQTSLQFGPFLAKFSPQGSTLLCSFVFGGATGDGVYAPINNSMGIAVDSSGCPLIVGSTSTIDFPVLNAIQASYGGAAFKDGFVSKFDASGSALVFSSYLGGSGTDEAYGVAVDPSRNVYITGYTGSANFPTSSGAFSRTLKPTTTPGYLPFDAFVTKLSPTGQLVYSTYFGGSHIDRGETIAVDDSGRVWLGGTSWSADLPVLDPLAPKATDSFEGFMSALNAQGSGLIFSSFLTWAYDPAVAVDHQGSAYVTCRGGFGPPFVSNFPYSGNCTVVKIGLSTSVRDTIQVWQELRLSSAGSFKSHPDSNIVTFDSVKAVVTRVSTDTISVLVPPELVKNRTRTDLLPDTTAREVTVIARVIRGPGDTAKVLEKKCLFIPPRLLIHDEVTRAAPPVRQGVLQGKGWRFVRTYIFLGYRTDGYAAARLTNTSTTFPPPISLLAKVISPPPVTLYDGSAWPSVGNLLNVGNQNAAIQFPIDKDGWYIIVVLGGPLPNPPVFPEVPNSPGPFPAQFQIHLAGNVGLPRKLINGAPEFPRGIRLDTYFNHPAPRIETLGNNGLVAGEWAETGLFKFANPVSVSQFPIAVLIPPALEGFPIGTPPIRAGPPLRMGQLPNQAIDITVPMATTTGAANPVPGTVMDLAQIPIPASVLGPGPPPGVAKILGATDGTGVTLPPPSSLIVDMGSGNEIVNGSGADFRVIALSGTYQVAVSNTPFAVTFIPVGSGTGQQDFDLEGTGLTSARYVRLAVSSGSASFDAVEALNVFTDQIHPTAGPLSDVGWATITMRRRKAPASAIDPLLELIGPDGSFLGKNESSFGDDTDADRSDAALIKIPLTQQGFYRYLGRGYDIQPDAQAFGTYFTRLETAGEYDPVELTVSTKAEDQTAAQKQGTISLPRQRDSYLFQASSGTTVKIVVNGVGSPALVDPLVELYDPEDFLIAANDNYTGRGKNAVITVTLPTTGRTFPDPSTYRIVVMGSDKTTGVTTSVSNSLFHVRQANGGKYEVKVFTGSLTGSGPTAPTVVSISPDAVVQGATNVAVSISGTNFTDGATVAFSGTGVTITSVAFVSTSKLSVTCNVASEAAVGLRDVTVTNPGGLAGSAVGVLQVRKTLGSVVLNWSAPPGGQTMTAPGGLTAQLNPSTGESASGKSLAGGSGRVGRKGDYAPRAPHGAGPSRTVVQASVIKEVEPNNSPAQAQVLIGDTLIEVDGRAEVRDVGTVTDVGDDIEDLFKVSTKSPGLTILLSGFTSDCDLFLIDPADTTILDASLNTASSGFEAIEWQDLPAGTFLIGVSIYDPDPIGPDSTAYKLQVAGDFGGTTALTLQSYNVYRSITANARGTGIKAGSVGVGTTSFSDPVPYTGNFYYQVTAVYNQGESEPSNEVSKVVTEVGRQVTSDLIPAGFALHQNYPNPFNPGTTIRYDLPKASYVRIEVYSMLGQCIRILVDGQMSAGLHTVDWDSRTGVGTPAPSGVYMYRMVAGEFSQTRKLLLLR